MGIDFPVATTVGQTYTDPTSGNTYAVTVVGPPAQWVGSGSSTSLDNTYLRKDASNDPVTGTLTVTPATNVEGLVVTQPSGNSAAAMRITNEGSGNSLLIEDSASTDSTPIVADSAGRFIVGRSSTRTNFWNTTTFTPAIQLETAGTSGDSTRIISAVFGDAGTNGPNLVFGKHRGTTVGGNTIVANGDEIGLISFQAADGTNLVPAAGIRGAVDGTPGVGDMPGRLMFFTTPDASSTPAERMRITNAGDLLLGGTLPSAPNAQIWANGRFAGQLFHTSSFDYNGGGTQTVFTPVRGATYLVISQLVNYTIPSTDTRHGILAFAARTTYGVDVTTVTQIGAATGQGTFSVSGSSIQYNGGSGNPQCLITWMQISAMY